MKLREKRRKILDREKEFLHLHSRFEDAFSLSLLLTMLDVMLDICLEGRRQEELRDIVECMMSRRDVNSFFKDNNLYEKIIRLYLEIGSCNAKKN